MRNTTQISGGNERVGRDSSMDIDSIKRLRNGIETSVVDAAVSAAMLHAFPSRSRRTSRCGALQKMQKVGAFAEFERAMLPERTKAGLDSARWEGRIGGGRPKLTAQQQSEIRKMVSKGRKTARRRCPPIQSPPCHRLATAGAGLRQIACKVLCQIICKVTTQGLKSALSETERCVPKWDRARPLARS